MAGDAGKEYTAGGNKRAPARRILVAWVLKAWNKLDTERVKNFLKVCVCVCGFVCLCWSLHESSMLSLAVFVITLFKITALGNAVIFSVTG